MSFFEKVLNKIEERRNRKLKGLYNGIPFPFPTYQENYMHSIEKGLVYGILGPTGGGKSRWARNTFIYHPIKFSLEKNYPIKILYFSLEDSKELTYRKILSHYLWERHNKIIKDEYLTSTKNPLPEEILNLLKKDKEFFESLEDILYIIDDTTNPSDINKKCEAAYKKYGDEYHYIVIIDNYANVSTEDGMSRHESVGKLSREYVRLNLAKKLKMTILVVLQQDADTNKNAARNSETRKLNTIEPQLSSIAVNKEVQRDIFILWALFSPWDFEIENYPFKDGWKTNILRDKFRALITLKNNEGEMAPRMGMYFRGTEEVFEELPNPSEVEKLDVIYQKRIKEEEEKRRIKITGKLF